MASVVGVKSIEKPVSRSMPTSIGAQRAIFWLGIFLTTLALISSLGQLLRSGEDLDLRVIMKFISIAFFYWCFFSMRSRWSKPLDELRLETLAEVSLSDMDLSLVDRRPMKILFGLYIVSISLIIMMAILDDRMSSMHFMQLPMILIFSISIWFNQPPRLRIVSSGLLWERPTSTVYFPWGIVDSVRFAPGITLDRVLWTAPGWWGKPFNYETKIVKLSEEDREKFLSVIGERVEVSTKK